jgi:hypothetical protein
MANPAADGRRLLLLFLLKNCCCVELVALMFTSAKTTKISQGSADGYGQDKSR